MIALGPERCAYTQSSEGPEKRNVLRYDFNQVSHVHNIFDCLRDQYENIVSGNHIRGKGENAKEQYVVHPTASLSPNLNLEGYPVDPLWLEANVSHILFTP